MSEWKPIETAPKDGSWILVYRPPAGGGWWDRIVICKWDAEVPGFIWPSGVFDIYKQDIDERDGHGDYAHDIYELGDTGTHWMPLPSPPTSQEPSE